MSYKVCKSGDCSGSGRDRGARLPSLSVSQEDLCQNFARAQSALDDVAVLNAAQDAHDECMPMASIFSEPEIVQKRMPSEEEPGRGVQDGAAVVCTRNGPLNLCPLKGTEIRLAAVVCVCACAHIMPMV